MMRDDALFNLRWDAQRTALLGSVASLYRDESFVDVTIVTNGQMFKAHKLLLSASSPYLKSILESVPSHHAVLFMPHIPASDLSNVLKFIYDGEIKINRRALKSFLETAKTLKIKGMDFEFDGELTDLDGGGGGGGNQSSTGSESASTSAAATGSLNSANRSTSPPSASKPAATSSADEEPPEKLKILSALLLNKKEPQASDVNYQSMPSPHTPKNALPRHNNNNNNNNNNNHHHNNNHRAELKNGTHEEVVVEESEEDVHNDLDMVMEDENDRSQQRMYHMDPEGNLIDIDDEEGDDHIQDYEEEEEDMSILPEVSIQESEESYTISNAQLQQYRTGQGLSAHGYLDPKAMSKLRPIYPKNESPSGNFNDGILLRMMREPLLSSKWSPSTSVGVNAGAAAGGAGGGGYDVGHPEGVGGLRKTKRYVQCGSCSKVLSSLSALKRHMEDVHCARIQGKCIICGRVYSSRNSLLTHVYSAHKKHEDYKAVARIIRESDFEKFATA